MVLDASLLNTQHYKVRIKGKVEQSREKSSTFSYTLVLQLSKREPSCHHRLKGDKFTFLLLEEYWGIGLMSRVLPMTRATRVQSPGRVIPKTQKMVLDTALLCTPQYKERIKGKVEQSWEWSSAIPYTSVLQLLKREPFGHRR